MPSSSEYLPTRLPQPIILVRGFGGLSVEDEKRVAYQGFNDGTVYPHKRGVNYIYEGLVLRLMKSDWSYQDATNVVGYHGQNMPRSSTDLPPELKAIDESFFYGNKVIIDPGVALSLLKDPRDPQRSLWIFRYYDLNDRTFETYGKALARLIEFIRVLTAIRNNGTPAKVNILAHSMGGLIVRELVQKILPSAKKDSEQIINKIVTLGTPHQGISFQLLKNWMPMAAKEELDAFNPDLQRTDSVRGFAAFADFFPPHRLLTIVGTDYRSYGPTIASWMNRAFSAEGEFGLNYNRSDGLVKQTHAQIPGAPRTFVHKCHGGPDSLVTSRESFEIASRFFFGNLYVRLYLEEARVTRGFDLIGKSELFFGVSIKPRGVDFDLFHQSPEAENCYGPFTSPDLMDDEVAFDWAGEDRLIWEGWLNSRVREQSGPDSDDVVIRLDVYVGERDLFGIGFSDNIIFRKQYFVRAQGSPIRLFLHKGEEFRTLEKGGEPMESTKEGWSFAVEGSGFTGKLRISLASVPDVGEPEPITSIR